MAETAMFLLVASTVGAIDVLWWHLYRFRLYEQPASVLEEATHLARYGLFLAVAVVLLSADDPASVRWLVLGLCAADLAVTAVDVLSEPSSRAPLGGLPRLEYLVHVLATFALGGAAATFWWTAERGGTVLTGDAELQVAGAAATTAGLMAVEATLFVRNRCHSRAAGDQGTLRAAVASCWGVPR